MAEAVPTIRATDPQSKANGLEKEDVNIKDNAPASNSKITSALRKSPTFPDTLANDQSTPNGNTEGRKQSETSIDPLSQQILQRTGTQSAVQKLRTPTENASQSLASPNEQNADTNLANETAKEISPGIGLANSKPDKKKGVSFLSRIIGNKKKGALDGGTEDGSEAGDSRPEGMDAELFSHTADNLGFSPKHPQPPAYIKVRSKFKKEREFNRVFLAQELRPSSDKSTPRANGTTPVASGAAATHNPIWATEFSRDGRYLAAGGQDRIVRVWAVISSPEERRAHEKEESAPDAAGNEATHLSAPVFQQKPFKEYHGHTATILDLSWSKNNFLLSSSMDKTVRLWHISRNECLCTFKHTDFVPSIQFHPRDDRFFLAGSLDTKLRLWSIPDKSVAFWNQLPDMITAVSFTPDGKTCIAGTLSGLCMFYETEGLKYQTQIHVKSTRGQNAKGSKITGIQATYFPPGNHNGEVKLLISSNDSRVRLYNFRDKSLEVKFRGHENNCSQIRASFADDSGYVICGSEDRKAYIWSTTAPEGDKRNQKPMEMFDAHNSITTCSILAPLKTRQLLSNSEDPLYDLCNPPPVTLVSKAESISSSRAPTEAGTPQPTPAPTESHFRRVKESPAYIARSAHTDGNIIVTADYTGNIKVFRQDCAYLKRFRAGDQWETSSVFSKKIGGRPSSIISRTTARSRRDSTSTQPPNDRIMSWRQDISHGSFDSVNGMGRGKPGRSISPRKSLGQISYASSARPVDSPAVGPASVVETPSVRNTSPKRIAEDSSSESKFSTPPRQSSTASNSADPAKLANARSQSTFEQDKKNPMKIYNGQSWAFWNTNTKTKLAPPDRPELLGRVSTISKLSSEENYTD